MFWRAHWPTGAERVLIFASTGEPDRLTGLEQQVSYLDAVLDGLGHAQSRISIVDEQDAEALCDALYALEPLAECDAASFLPAGGRRSLAAMAMHQLHKTAPAPVDIIAMPDGAPFGAVEINIEGCTLCLACVGSCPTGALSDNPDSPRLSFTEQACIQCGLCRNTCPESVMTLVPRMNFTSSANSSVVLKEEEPFECISCGKPYGTRSSIEKTIGRLVNHPMFAGDDAALERLRMCENCRVLAQFSVGHPMSHGTERRTRTTDDYLSEEEDDDC